MDYLKTHHPNDHEKMQMVALKFGMFYELAKSTQEKAKENLRKIKPKHLGIVKTITATVYICTPTCTLYNKMCMRRTHIYVCDGFR